MSKNTFLSPLLLQVLVNALLSSRGGDAGVVTDRRGEGRSACEASLFNKERIRHGQHLPDMQTESFLRKFEDIKRFIEF